MLPLLPLKESAPVLLSVTLPPSDAGPPPEIPVPGTTLIKEFCSIALVTPLFAMLMVPEDVIGPPTNPDPVLIDRTPDLIACVFGPESITKAPAPTTPVTRPITCPDVG